MMSCSFVNAEQASKYFEHTTEYYTKNMTNYDRWHGSLAQAYGLDGELSKEQFDEVLKDIAEQGRERAGLDCTFSAPKSVSLAMAKDEETRQDMITSHQKAVEEIAKKIELELLQTRTDGKKIFSRNAIMAEFMHTMARPTKSNDDIPDLDLHSHCVFLNKTVVDGKDLALDFEKVMSREKIKEYGLVYRQELAKELQNKGYELEITDSRQGFFEIKGFDRETVMEYSNRRQEMLKLVQEKGITDMQAANQFSRQVKAEGKADYDEVLEQTKKDLFETGKIKIDKKERIVENDQRRTDEDNREVYLHESKTRQRDSTSYERFEAKQHFESFERKQRLSELPNIYLDGTEQNKHDRVSLLLSKNLINRLGKFQTERVRHHFVQRKEREQRLNRIDEITAETINKLEKEKYAFTVPEAKQRIMAAGVLEAITSDEAKAAMERAGLVKLGHIERDNGKSKDVYLTTEKNIEIEKAVTDRVKTGKGVIKENVLTMEESIAMLEKVESIANAEERAAGKREVKTREGEQGEAVHHILTSNDKYIGVNGLAGTGKTTMMERLKRIADEKGIVIKGVCFTGKAADGLQLDSGIESTTIHSFLNKLEKESQQGTTLIKDDNEQGIKQEWDFSNVTKGTGREIWAVDEAGLVDMHLMNQLQKAAEARGAQVLLLGDPDQLPPVGAGEPMRMMEEAGMGTAHLTNIFRQRDTELLKAVNESVKGDTLVTFEVLKEKGDYREVTNKAERLQTIKDEMTAAPLDKYHENLLLVTTNADRKAYNKAIRAEYISRGELEKGNTYQITVHDGEKDKQEKREFAPKDRIIFTANDKRLGVMNGSMATIEKINGNEVTAKLDGGTSVTWNMEKYNSIDHSYAVTNYKAQGMTVDKVVADMNTKGSAQSRNALYVDISRARQKAVVFTDNKEKLERQTRNFAKKVTSKDFESKIRAMREQQGIKNNDRYHAPDKDRSKELEKALSQIKEHTKPPLINRLEKVVEQREAQRVAQRAALEKAQNLGKSLGKGLPQPQQTKTISVDRGFSR